MGPLAASWSIAADTLPFVTDEDLDIGQSEKQGKRDRQLGRPAGQPGWQAGIFTQKEEKKGTADKRGYYAECV